ncbi:MAG: FtsW/RodA/SpoVE family cell cycle protein, partial [Sulfitobacter sp.]|nr:FtsW/RodA/SpoVE family cell cycle protein [Sulfitobacter sp.]
MIALQPDFGTLLIYGLTFAALYWLAGGKAQHLAAAAIAALLLAVAVYQRTPYVRARIQGFLQPAA